MRLNQRFLECGSNSLGENHVIKSIMTIGFCETLKSGELLILAQNHSIFQDTFGGKNFCPHLMPHFHK